jgi:putative cardiolipin synthase
MAPLEAGNDALGARLGMIGTARRSVDIKTFLIKPGDVGALLARALREAAERGVAVRLLFDDVFTTMDDARLAALDAHPNIEIRSFNPLSRSAPRLLDFLTDFGRVNRRMHNKAFVVDDAYAIIGGRNIAGEYYEADAAADFGDFDLLLAGEAVRDVSAAFELYWADPWSVPLARIAQATGPGSAPGAAASAREAALRERSVNAAYLGDLKAGRVALHAGEVRVVVDPPDKLRRPPRAGPFPVADALYDMLASAEREATVVTPYFIPQERGMAVFEALLARGVRLRIVTNSLGSTNHPYVHGAYARYRARLLALGAEVREMRAAPGAGPSRTLHAKLAVIDEARLFAGSNNLDPRSVLQNSEIGVVIDSPGLAARIDRGLDAALESHAFRVALDADGRLVWTFRGEDGEEAFATEPGASLLDRVIAAVSGWLPIEDQL